MGTVISFNKHEILKQAEKLETIYNRFRKTNAICFKSELTPQLEQDIRALFFDRTWYTEDYFERLSEDDQTGVELTLDLFDKLDNKIWYDNENELVMIDYPFFMPVNDLKNPKEQIESGAWDNLNFTSFQDEIDNLEILESFIKSLLEKQ